MRDEDGHRYLAVLTPVRILVTGSREWEDEAGVRRILGAFHPDSTVVHGAARGLDSIAARVAEELGMKVEAHPADWDGEGKKAGILRNKRMVELGADYCLAFPLPKSKGTWDCMRRAEAAGIMVINCTDIVWKEAR